jgi:hypothetical protein
MLRDKWFWAATIVGCIVVALIWSAIWQGLEPRALRMKEPPPLHLPPDFSAEAQAAWERMRPLYGDFAVPPMRCRTEGGQRICQPMENHENRTFVVPREFLDPCAQSDWPAYCRKWHKEHDQAEIKK